jgi:hypothetical protein
MRYDPAVQKAQVEPENNGVDGMRHQEAQAFASVGRGYQPEPIILQQVQLDRIAVNAQ